MDGGDETAERGGSGALQAIERDHGAGARADLGAGERALGRLRETWRVGYTHRAVDTHL
jgi:hypothetical protein